MRLLFKYSLFWYELAVIIACFVLLSVSRKRSIGVLGRWHRWGTGIARHSRLAVAISFFLPIVLRLSLWPLLGLPVPSMHDEFSFLLMADTFASGRLTNPTHPLWIHFETFHVIQHPTYASIYPVMQGAFLALGEVIAHLPWLGVCLSVGLMCAAICWALQAWMPPFWAFAGAVLAAVRLGIFSYWMNSYWGGATAAIGGALVLGSLPRVLRAGRSRDAALLGTGLAVLANSRPYEGFAFSLPVAAIFLAWMLGMGRVWRWCGFRGVRIFKRSDLVRVVMTLALVLVAAGVFMGYYFWRVTGDPLKMPYMAEAEQYSVTPLFVWQKLRPPPAYNNERLRVFFAEVAPGRLPARERAWWYWSFYLGPVLTIPLLVLPWMIRDRRVRFLLIVSGVTVFAIAVEWWSIPHYAAPMTAAVYGLIMQGLRHLRLAPRRFWRRCAAVVPLTVVTMVAVRIAISCMHVFPMPDWPPSWASMNPVFNHRYVLENFLRRQGGRHLVLVHYSNGGRGASVHNEWVYNAADIDRSPIVWARDLGEERNQQLLQYYRDREVWSVDPDQGTPVRVR